MKIRLLSLVLDDIDSLLLYAGVHVKVFGYHRALSRRFPYAIYYLVEGDEIQVWRVLDCRQNPASLPERLQHD